MYKKELRDVDDFVVQMLGIFEEKQFRSVNDKDLGLETEDEKKEYNELMDVLS